MFISKMVVLETARHTWGSDIPKVTREQNFGKPLPVNLVESLAKSMLNPETVKVIGLDSDGKQVGSWLYTYSDISLDAPAAKGQSSAAKKGQSKKTEGKVKAPKPSKSEKEALELAKAPKALLPIQGHLSSSHLVKETQGGRQGACHKLMYADRGMASVPFIHSESKATVRLFRADGKTVDIPVIQGLFTSAVSRGKALSKTDPSADTLVYVKRLIAELLLGQDEVAIVQSEDSEDSVTHYSRGKAMGITHTNRAKVSVSYIRACLISKDLTVDLTRAQAYESLPALKVDSARRKDTTQYHKRVIPFGSSAISFMGRAKDTHVSFSRG